MAKVVINIEENALSAPFGVDGRYLYVEECEAPFELQVSDYPAVELDKNDDVDLLDFGGKEQRVIRLRDVSHKKQQVVIECSAMPFTKKRNLHMDASAMVGLVEDSIVGINSQKNIVRIMGEVAQNSTQHGDVLAKLSDIAQVQQSLTTSLAALPTALTNMMQTLTASLNAARSRRIGSQVMLIQESTIFNDAISLSIFSIDKKDYKVNGVVVPFSVVTTLEEAVGALHQGVTVAPVETGARAMVLVQKEIQV